MYRAILSRRLPSIDHFLFTPKKYLPLLFSTTSFEMRGPVYSTIFFPFGIRLTANSPLPAVPKFLSATHNSVAARIATRSRQAWQAPLAPGPTGGDARATSASITDLCTIL